MKIKVEQRHIDEGQRNTCSKCPIALAAKEQLGAKRVEVMDYLTWWDDDGTPYHTDATKHTVSLPPAARLFIRDFDATRAVVPFEFEVFVVGVGT